MAIKRPILLTLFALIWAGLIVVGASYLFDSSRPASDVTARLGRGGREMNILIPAQAGQRARMISVYTDGQAMYFTPEPAEASARCCLRARRCGCSGAARRGTAAVGMPGDAPRTLQLMGEQRARGALRAHAG